MSVRQVRNRSCSLKDRYQDALYRQHPELTNPYLLYHNPHQHHSSCQTETHTGVEQHFPPSKSSTRNDIDKVPSRVEMRSRNQQNSHATFSNTELPSLVRTCSEYDWHQRESQGESAFLQPACNCNLIQKEQLLPYSASERRNDERRSDQRLQRRVSDNQLFLVSKKINCITAQAQKASADVESENRLRKLSVLGESPIPGPQTITQKYNMENNRLQ